MTATVYQTDKRSGITYAYQFVSYWDKEKQQSRSKRSLMGRVDKETGEIVPTDGRGRKNNRGSVLAKRSPVPTIETARSFYGATYLLDAIGDKLGITDDVKQCFPNSYRLILSIAYYLILEDRNPLFRFGKWSSIHRHPYGKNITSQRSSDLFASYIKKQMQEHDLFENYTLTGVLDKLDVIEYFDSPGQKLRVGELLEKQKALYIDLGVRLPTSL